ncbi:MAG TPA: tryptophan synthase subunit alpha, partial [Phycisphaerales bacterium]|nr:tryptophan synthase subunit alpha [Phycisphaerales bacterium]
MPFLCAGHPSPESTTGAIGALARAGASVIEVGFPFSDPIADGPTIAAAMHEALLAGVTPRDVLRAVERARGGGGEG